MTIALRYAAKTDVGLVRSNNQDSGYAGSHLLVVADGMGGHAGGDVASSVAVGTLAELETDAPGTDIVAALESAVLDANDAILRRAREEPQLAGLGTTVTALLRAGNKFALVHIGDSRAYLVRDGQCTQVTKDHTFVQRLIDEGRLTPEEAERHPQRSMIMRVLGDVDADPELDLSLKPAVPGDRWMLCSDGLSGLVSFETISDVLATVEDPEECAEHLVELALKAGGPDNITCVIADVIDLDTLRKGDPGPSSGSVVVGAAARDRHRPTAATGPAARAAALTREEAPYEDEDYEEEPPRRSTWPVIALFTLIGALLVGGVWFAYDWTQDQYYVGSDGENVVVYKGIAQDLGPLSLSHEEEVTDVALNDLQPVTQTQVTNTISAKNREDADRIVAQLAAEGSLSKDTSADASDQGGASDSSGTPSDGGQ
ncbi:Stp1/IreP family PP2C-type Ser/Thr phosphatase [Dermabacter sp. HSID17554]|uniref:Stp1/IreP family PP2C-type Ser/Thr phosphatase n=1 Tax=Dermabacter sp. HSID17554 TaxID=2419511 RepID=UPI000F87308C|nr:Stp1/IreP family PP2C-type Ser/Thr phosphatase [Dermabacter sp. HSID17554]RUP86608.1 Stp1/IreP family PP2C-type Ser/Thr phosphatase [Dermabacter sp. HSID17554]